MESPVSYFSGLCDPRIDRTKAHLLDDIIFIAIAFVLCGTETWNETVIEHSRTIVHMVTAWAE